MIIAPLSVIFDTFKYLREKKAVVKRDKKENDYKKVKTNIMKSEIAEVAPEGVKKKNT